MKKTVMNDFPASKKVYVEGSQGIFEFHFVRLSKHQLSQHEEKRSILRFVFMIQVVHIQMKM